MALLRTALGRTATVIFIAIAFAMAGCSVQGSGGSGTDSAGIASTSSYALNGTITGLTSAGLVLANGTETLSVAANATNFTLTNSVAYATGYAVTVATQPSGLTCSVVNGSGTMPASKVTNIAVTCLENSYTLGGSITGLTGAGLILADGGSTFAVNANATSFTLSVSLAYASHYAVTVAVQPSGLSCSVANGAGTMPAADVTNIAVTCSANSSVSVPGRVYQCNQVPPPTGFAVDTNSLGLSVTMPNCTNLVVVPWSSATLTLQRWHPGDLSDPNAIWQSPSSLPPGWSVWTPNGWETLSVVQSGTTPPTVPTGLSVTSESSSTIALSWTASTDSGGPGLAGYTIYRNGTPVGTSAVASFTDVGLSSGTEYSYDVAAYDKASNASGQSAPVSAVTLSASGSAELVYQCDQAPLPTGFAVDTNSLGLPVTMPKCNNMVVVPWSSATLTLQRWHPGDLTDPNAIWQSPSSLPPGWSIWTPSGWETLSVVESGTTPPTVPTAIGATGASSSTIQLTWTASTDSGGPGLAGYTIYRNGAPVGTSAVASFTDVGLTASTAYSYDVAAYDSASNASGQSAPVTATTLTVSGGSPQLVYQCNQSPPPTGFAVDNNSLGQTVTMPDCSTMVAVPWSSATLILQRWHPGDLTDPNAIWQSPGSLPPGWSIWTPNGWETLSVVESGTTPPTVPTALGATGASSSTIRLTWTASTDSGGPGLAGYTIYRNGTPVGTSAVASFTDVGLTASTQYSYDVAAYDSASNASGQSAPVSAATLSASGGSPELVYQCDQSPPPTGFAVDNNSLGQTVTMPDCSNMVAVPWSSATLTLQRWHPGDLTDPNAIWQSPGSLPPGWSIWTPSGWETLSVVESGTTPPTVPTALGATGASSSTIQLTWTASTDSGGPGLAGYTIYRNGAPVGTSAVTSFTDVGLTPSTQYSYDVAAYDSAANASGQSAPVSATTTAPAAPPGWIREGGSPSYYDGGTYGTLGVAAAGNVPGSRYQGGGWTDTIGNLWLFGGWGGDSTANDTRLNDIWMYSPSSQQWTWEGGSNVGNAYPNWGTQGVAAANNTPGGRDTFAWWGDSAGNLYLFGGDTLGTEWVLCNDLWKYDITTGLWTWLNGSTTCSLGPTPISNSAFTWETTTANMSVFGTLGVASASNIPGNRKAAATWTDASGDLWLFGGISYVNESCGYPPNSGVPECIVYLNDLWMYSPTTNLWTWMGGSQTPDSPGVYGTQGVGSTSNIPSAREVISGTTWADKAGNLWLFGGVSSSSSLPGGNNDLWKYNIASGEWTWVSGSDSSGGTGAGPSGVYGTQGVAAAGNTPAARYSSSSWIDSSGALWLWGGGQWQGSDGLAANGYTVNYDDLWTFVPSTGLWTWVNGTQNTQVGGNCGTLGVAASSNLPGARNSAFYWIDLSGNLWMFGGEGLDCNGNQGLLGDLWRY